MIFYGHELHAAAHEKVLVLVLLLTMINQATFLISWVNNFFLITWQILNLYSKRSDTWDPIIRATCFFCHPCASLVAFFKWPSIIYLIRGEKEDQYLVSADCYHIYFISHTLWGKNVFFSLKHIKFKIPSQHPAFLRFG